MYLLKGDFRTLTSDKRVVTSCSPSGVYWTFQGFACPTRNKETPCCCRSDGSCCSSVGRTAAGRWAVRNEVAACKSPDLAPAGTWGLPDSKRRHCHAAAALTPQRCHEALARRQGACSPQAKQRLVEEEWPLIPFWEAATYYYYRWYQCYWCCHCYCWCCRCC